MATGNTKTQLRERAKKNRRALNPDSAMVCRGLAHWLASPQRNAGWVVLYAAMPGEIDLASLATGFADLGPFALTRTPVTGRTLSVHPYDGERELHRYGYEQPVERAPTVADDEISVVLVPGLAFDRSGQRLGWGAGYYDRFLSRLAPGVINVGISDGLLLGEIPSEPHDVAMDYLATEAGVFRLPLD